MTLTTTALTYTGTRSTVATFLKFWTMGVVLSSIAYGVAFTLSISTVHCLHSNSKGHKQRRHYVLISYVLLMFCLSTVSIVSGIRTNLNAIAAGTIPAHIGVDENAIIVVLVTWLSDGLLVSDFRLALGLIDREQMSIRHSCGEPPFSMRVSRQSYEGPSKFLLYF